MTGLPKTGLPTLAQGKAWLDAREAEALAACPDARVEVEDDAGGRYLMRTYRTPAGGLLVWHAVFYR